MVISVVGRFIIAWRAEAENRETSLRLLGLAIQERKDATQPMGMLGVGVERRFSHLALQAELRAVAMGKAKDDANDPAVAAMTVTTDPGPRSADIQRNGGSLTLGLSYYF